MKQRILIYLALFLGSVSPILGQGQDNIGLNSPLKVTRDSAIVACKEITLNPSFEFTALAGKGLELNIDPTCATPEYGCITIIAKDASGNLLKGGVYKVTNTNDQQVGGNYTATTGSVNAINLKYSTYKVVQVTAPAGYELTTASTMSIAVTNDNCRDVEFKYKKQEKPILKGCITILAKDQTGSVVNGGVYKVLDADKQQVGSYYTANVNGSLEICEIVYGNYTIVEVTTPVKYRLLSGSLSSVTVDGSNAPNVFEYQLIEDKPYEKGKTGVVNIAIASGISLAPWDFRIDDWVNQFAQWDDYNNRNNWGDYIEDYKTIDIGEYTYTSQNLKGLYQHRVTMGSNYRWANWTDDRIKKITESYVPAEDETPLNVEDFYEFYGTWFLHHSEVDSYKDAEYRKISNINTGVVEAGWTLPNIGDMMQLMGQAPRKTGNIINDIMDFVAAGENDTPQGHVTDWASYSNTSGLTLTPLGLRVGATENIESGRRDFKKATSIYLQDGPNREGGAENSVNRKAMLFSNDYIQYVQEQEYNNQVRYCRPKTAEELGYKICIDQCHDAVVILPLNENTDLPEIPKGLERGIILRYANIENKTVSKSWLEIRQEAAEYRKVLTSLPDAPVLKFPQNCDKGGIRISGFLAANEYTYGGVYLIEDTNGQEWSINHNFEMFNFSPGKYIITELVAPEGCELLSNSIQEINVVANNTSVVEFKYKRVSNKYQVCYRWNAIGNPEVDPYTGGGDAVKIGEYYWINRNMHAGIDNDTYLTTKHAIDKSHMESQMFGNRQTCPNTFDNPDLPYWDYEGVSLELFNEYYGSYWQNQHSLSFGGDDNPNFTWTDDKGNVLKGWRLPQTKDALQLMAMCGNAKKKVMRQYLSQSHDDPTAPAFVNIIKTNAYYDWFRHLYQEIDGRNEKVKGDCWDYDTKNHNRYNFNLLPGGWKPKSTTGYGSPNYRCENGNDIMYWQTFTVHPNEIYALNQVAKLKLDDDTYFVLDDNPQITYMRLFEHVNMRFCQPISDEELGYKLYINQNMNNVEVPGADRAFRTVTGEEILLYKVRKGKIAAESIDIIKISDLNTPAPAGYVELPRGYIRGFYVQLMMQDPLEGRTIADIIDIAKESELVWVNKMLNLDLSQYNNTQSVDLPTTRQAEVKESRISVYPNPAQNVLYIDSTDEVQSVKIYSVSGSVVISLDKLNGNSIDVSSLASGMYVVRIQTEDGNYTQKVFKK